MFRSFVYLDENKMYTYKRQLDGRNQAQPKTMTQKRSADVSAGCSKLKATGSIETSIDSDFERDVSFDYDQFEAALQLREGEDYFDFVLNPEYDLTTIPAMKIIRLNCPFLVPEGFDAINLVERFMPMLMGTIETSSSEEQEAMEKILGEASADIPVVSELDDITVSGKLRGSNLKEEYSALEDYSEQDVFMLCKVVGVSRKQKVEVFDPLKDFVKLPRTMRRQMASDGNTMGLEKIEVDGPVLKVEVIAIYK